MHTKGDTLIFASRHQVEADAGIVGMTSEGPLEGCVIRCGYNGDMWLASIEDGVLSMEDTRELAEHMIRRWQSFLESVHDG